MEPVQAQESDWVLAPAQDSEWVLAQDSEWVLAPEQARARASVRAMVREQAGPERGTVESRRPG